MTSAVKGRLAQEGKTSFSSAINLAQNLCGCLSAVSTGATLVVCVAPMPLGWLFISLDRLRRTTQRTAKSLNYDTKGKDISSSRCPYQLGLDSDSRCLPPSCDRRGQEVDSDQIKGVVSLELWSDMDQATGCLQV